MSLRLLLAVLTLAGCANEADTAEAVAVDSVSIGNVVAPRLDTLTGAVDLQCDSAIEVRVNTYVGHEPRAVLAVMDTGMVLPQRVAAPGARYASDDGTIEWWSHGDSARLTFRGMTVACRPAGVPVGVADR